jgi:hypothetical protein
MCWPLQVLRKSISLFFIGLGFSVALMGIATGYIARLLHRHQWIAYAGLLVILYVACRDDLPRNGRGLAPDNPLMTSRLECGKVDRGTVGTPIAELTWV